MNNEDTESVFRVGDMPGAGVVSSDGARCEQLCRSANRGKQFQQRINQRDYRDHGRHYRHGATAGN